MDAPNRSVIAYVAGHLITGCGNWGWDHLSCCHFHGTVDENIVTLYDFQDLESHRYTL